MAEGDQLVQAVRAVATGGTALDPAIVDALMHPVRSTSGLSANDEELLRWVAEGKPIKAIAVARATTPEAVADDVERLFLELAKEASAGGASALRRLRLLHQAIVDREEQGETLSPSAARWRGRPRVAPRRANRREPSPSTVTVLMSDIRGYSTIAEVADPASLATQLNEHRRQMNHAILGAGGDRHAVRGRRRDGRVRRPDRAT